MKKIGLVTNFNIKDKADAAERVASYLSKFPCLLFVSEFMKEKVSRRQELSRLVSFVPNSKLYRDMDLIIVLGGDGSILTTARYCLSSGIPILGINLGRLGFMAEMEADEIEMLEKLFGDDYRIEERSMLDVSVLRGGKQLINKASALNDAVISNGSIARMVDLDLFAGERQVSRYRADGLIFSTPTGSTAYSMSAGGPVIDPSMRCICVTPICSHSLAARPIIFPDDALLCVKNICEREKNLYLTLDGRVNFEIYKNDIVQIRRSGYTAKLIKLKDQGFYNALHSKMNYGI